MYTTCIHMHIFVYLCTYFYICIHIYIGNGVRTLRASNVHHGEASAGDQQKKSKNQIALPPIEKQDGANSHRIVYHSDFFARTR